MRRSDELPKTSQPSPADFADIFEQIQKNGDTPLCITISSKLKAAFLSRVLGAELTKQGDSFRLSCGVYLHGIQVIDSDENGEKWRNC